MQSLHTVSETALLTLRSRVVESEALNPVLKDPVGKECFQELLETLPADLQDRIMKRKLSPLLTRHLALRARKYDALCREFLGTNPSGLLVNLGCGFDTRFWRLGLAKERYIELDLPEVISLKQELLGDKITYRTIGASVLSEEWIPLVQSVQAERVLFLAEGLFMYFTPEDSSRTLKLIASSFRNSRLVMEVVAAKYTTGFYKKLVEQKMRRRAGTEAGDYFLFGLKHASNLKSIHPAYEIYGEWSFFEDREVKPAFLRMFRNVKSIAKSQYTVIADIV
jgi:O-methyltransferase involved in polyketide biosynthesis